MSKNAWNALFRGWHLYSDKDHPRIPTALPGTFKTRTRHHAKGLLAQRAASTSRTTFPAEEGFQSQGVSENHRPYGQEARVNCGESRNDKELSGYELLQVGQEHEE